MFILLTLVLAATIPPAEGFVLFEEHEIDLRLQDSNAVVIPLSGEWQARVLEDDDWLKIGLPFSLPVSPETYELRYAFQLPAVSNNIKWKLIAFDCGYTTEFILNETSVFSGQGYRENIECEISKNTLRPGAANQIVIRISNNLDKTSTMPLRAGLMEPAQYGGLLGGIYLIGFPRSSIDAIQWKSDVIPDSGVTGHINTTVYARIYVISSSADSVFAPLKLEVTVKDSTEKIYSSLVVEVPTLTQGSTALDIKLPEFTADLWSPDSPNLYQLSARLYSGEDTLSIWTKPCGFKSWNIDKDAFLLNGMPITIHGIDYIPAERSDLSQIENDLTKIKSWNFNCIRVIGGICPEILFNAADQIGLLIFMDSSFEGIPNDLFVNNILKEKAARAVDFITQSSTGYVSAAAIGIGSFTDEFSVEAASWKQEFTNHIKTITQLLVYSESPSLQGNPIGDFQLWSRIPLKIENPTVPFLKPKEPIVISMIGYPSDLSEAVQAEIITYQISGSRETGKHFVLHSYSDYIGAVPLLAQPHDAKPPVYTFGLMTRKQDEKPGAEILHTYLSDDFEPVDRPKSVNKAITTFPAVSLGVLLLLSVSIRRNNVFRQNLRRVFFHAHGFYSDIRRRRFVPPGQTFVLWVGIALSLSMALVSLLYAGRLKFNVDYYLYTLFGSSSLKLFIDKLIWQPGLAVIYFTIFFLLLLLIAGGIIRLMSIPFKPRIAFPQAFILTVWPLASLLILLPLSAVLYKFPEAGVSGRTVLIILTAVGLWTFVRIMNALRTGFETSIAKTVGMTLVTATILFVAGYFTIFRWLRIGESLNWFHSVFGNI